MAEAQGQGNPPPPPSFFCHKCNTNIGPVQEDFTCPTCGSGFIEEVTASSHNAASQAGAGLGNIMEAFTGGMNHGFDFMDLFGMGNQPRRQRAHAPQGQGGNGVPGQGGGMNFGGFTSTSVGPGLLSFSFGGPSGGGRGTAQGVGQGNAAENPVEHMLYSFLSDLIHGLGGENTEGQPGAGMPLLGNLGDYVWGRDGLDAIVTQLMNQMEGSGPPPLPTDKLEQLPTVNITQEQVDRKLQCSVCWDNFQLSDAVKQLDCEHVYHPDCILPWLKLHGTCPICRRDFTDGKKDGEDSSSPTTDIGGSTSSSGTNPNPNPTRAAQTSGPVLPADLLNLFNIPPRPGGVRNPNSSTQSQSGQDQGRTGSTRNPRGPPNLDMDMEFD